MRCIVCLFVTTIAGLSLGQILHYGGNTNSGQWPFGNNNFRGLPQNGALNRGFTNNVPLANQIARNGVFGANGVPNIANPSTMTTAANIINNIESNLANTNTYANLIESNLANNLASANLASGSLANLDIPIPVLPGNLANAYGFNANANYPNFATSLASTSLANAIANNNYANGLNPNVASFNYGSAANPFTITSGSPGNQGFGIQILADALEVGGNVAVTGKMPVYGTVSLNGNLPTDGTATVNYGCSSR